MKNKVILAGLDRYDTTSKHDTAMGLESTMSHKLVQVKDARRRMLVRVVVVLVWL